MEGYHAVSITSYQKAKGRLAPARLRLTMPSHTLPWERVDRGMRESLKSHLYFLHVCLPLYAQHYFLSRGWIYFCWGSFYAFYSGFVIFAWQRGFFFGKTIIAKFWTVFSSKFIRENVLDCYWSTAFHVHNINLIRREFKIGLYLCEIFILVCQQSFTWQQHKYLNYTSSTRIV